MRKLLSLFVIVLVYATSCFASCYPYNYYADGTSRFGPACVGNTNSAFVTRYSFAVDWFADVFELRYLEADAAGQCIPESNPACDPAFGSECGGTRNEPVGGWDPDQNKMFVSVTVKDRRIDSQLQVNVIFVEFTELLLTK